MKNTADEQQADANDPAVATEEPIAPVELGTITPEQFSELKERAAKSDENWERLLRLTPLLRAYRWVRGVGSR